jgi:hypothetical protein
MSSGPKKSAAKKTSPSDGPPGGASVRDVVARASHLREVVAIVRAASVEFVNRFNGIGRELPELLLQRVGHGARPATVEAILEVEAALEGVAREFESRANALLSMHVESGESIERVHEVAGIGADLVVHRDCLERPYRPRLQRDAPPHE